MWSFREVVGNRKITEHLQEAISRGRVAHAYLFSGPDGIGKRFVAERFAAALLCEKKGSEPCGQCRSCLQMLGGNQPDVTYVTRTKTVIGVDDIREQVNQPMSIKPYAGKYRIFLIDEAEKMNEAAQNALLKTLEEPPAYGVIVLLCSRAERLLETIRSRVVHLPFLPVGDEEIVAFLMEKYQIPDYRARLAAALAGGSPGMAAAFAASEQLQARREAVVRLMKSLPSDDAHRRVTQTKELAAAKESLADDLELMLLWIRDLLVYKAAGAKGRLMYPEEAGEIARQADALSYEALRRMQEELSAFRAKKDANVNLETGVWIMLSHLSECFYKQPWEEGT